MSARQLVKRWPFTVCRAVLPLIILTPVFSQAVVSVDGYLANERFCRGKGYPTPTMQGNDRNYTLDCFKVGSFSGLATLFPHVTLATAGEPSALTRRSSELPAPWQNAVENFLSNHPVMALVVEKKGSIIYEGYRYGRTPQTQFASFSMHKSLTGMLIGIALAEGKLTSLEQPVTSILTELRGSDWDSLSIWHLLTMTSGLRSPKWRRVGVDMLFRDIDLMDTLRGLGAVNMAPGKGMYYSDLNVFALSEVLERVYRKPWATIFREKIWLKISPEQQATVITTASGKQITNAMFNATARDYLRLGQLLMREGKNSDGEQVIPAQWVRMMQGKGEAFNRCPLAPQRSCQGRAGMFGYSFLTWLPQPGVFAMWGRYGQLIVGEPRTGLLLVVLAASRPGYNGTYSPSFVQMVEQLRQPLGTN